MTTTDGPMYGQPAISMTVGKNGYRTFFTEVIGPADAMHPGGVVVASAEGSEYLILLGDVEVTEELASCTDFKVLRCQKHPGNSLRVVDQNSKRFQGMHVECDRCETLTPYRANMTLAAMGATA